MNLKNQLQGPILNLDRDVPQVIMQPLSGGISGNYETVTYMQNIAHKWKANPLVRALATEAVKDLPSHEYAAEARAVGEFVQKRVRYVQDPLGVEQLTMPDTMSDQILRNGSTQGDCDDQSLLTATMLLALGHEPRYRLARYHGTSGPYNHIYVVDYARDGAYGPKRRIVLDPIVKDKPIGFEIAHESGEEIQV